ncbi:hypothetical protein Nmel_011204 [Mimus melanotis]
MAPWPHGKAQPKGPGKGWRWWSQHVQLKGHTLAAHCMQPGAVWDRLRWSFGVWVFFINQGKTCYLIILINNQKDLFVKKATFLP